MMKISNILALILISQLLRSQEIFTDIKALHAEEKNSTYFAVGAFSNGEEKMLVYDVDENENGMYYDGIEVIPPRPGNPHEGVTLCIKVDEKNEYIDHKLFMDMDIFLGKSEFSDNKIYITTYKEVNEFKVREIDFDFNTRELVEIKNAIPLCAFKGEDMYVFFKGDYNNKAIFFGDTIHANTSMNAFIYKMDINTKEVEYKFVYKQDVVTGALELIIDENDQVHVLGDMYAGIRFENGDHYPTQTMFMGDAYYFKLDEKGNRVTTKIFRGDGSENVRAWKLVGDKLYGTFISDTQGLIIFEKDTLTNNSNQYYGTLLCMDLNGKLLWHKDVYCDEYLDFWYVDSVQDDVSFVLNVDGNVQFGNTHFYLENDLLFIHTNNENINYHKLGYVAGNANKSEWSCPNINGHETTSIFKISRNNGSLETYYWDGKPYVMKIQSNDYINGISIIANHRYLTSTSYYDINPHIEYNNKKNVSINSIPTIFAENSGLASEVELISLFDISGRMIWQGHKMKLQEMSLENLSSGMYILLIKSGEKQIIHKIIIQ